MNWQELLIGNLVDQAHRLVQSATSDGLPSVKWLISEYDDEVLDACCRRLRARGEAWTAHVWRFVAGREPQEAWETASAGCIVASRDTGCFIVFVAPGHIPSLPASIVSNQSTRPASDGGPLSPLGIARATLGERAILGSVHGGVAKKVLDFLDGSLERNRASSALAECWFRWVDSYIGDSAGQVPDARALGVIPSARLTEIGIWGDGAPLIDELERAGGSTRNHRANWLKMPAILGTIQLEDARWVGDLESRLSDAGDDSTASRTEDLRAHLVQFDFQARAAFPASVFEWPLPFILEVLEGEKRDELGPLEIASVITRTPDGLPVVCGPIFDFTWRHSTTDPRTAQVTVETGRGGRRPKSTPVGADAGRASVTLNQPASDGPLRRFKAFLTVNGKKVKDSDMAFWVAPSQPTEVLPKVALQTADHTELFGQDSAPEIREPDTDDVLLWTVDTDGSLVETPIPRIGAHELEPRGLGVWGLPASEIEWPEPSFDDERPTVRVVHGDKAIEIPAPTDYVDDPRASELPSPVATLADKRLSSDARIEIHYRPRQGGGGIRLRPEGAPRFINLEPREDRPFRHLEAALLDPERTERLWPLYVSDDLRPDPDVPWPSSVIPTLDGSLVSLRATLWAELRCFEGLPLAWRVVLSDHQLVEQYVRTWVQTVEMEDESRNSLTDAQDRERRASGLLALGAIDTLVDNRTSAAILSPLHPCMMLWLLRAWTVAHERPGLEGFAGLIQGQGPEYLPPFLSLTRASSAEQVIMSQVVASDWAWCAYRGDGVSDDEAPLLRRFRAALGAATEVGQSTRDVTRVSRAVRSFHKFHPFRRDLSIRWLNAPVEDWRSLFLGTTSSPAAGMTLQAFNHERASLRVVAPRSPDGGDMRSPAPDPRDALQWLKPASTDDIDEADISFIGEEVSVRETPVRPGQLFGNLLGGGLALEPARVFDFDRQDKSGSIIFRVLPGIVDDGTPMSKVLVLLQRLSALRGLDEPTDPKEFRGIRTVLHMRRPDENLIVHIEEELRRARWLFVSGDQADPELFDRMESASGKPTYLVHYSPRVRWAQSAAHEDHGLVAVTTHREEVRQALARHVSRVFEPEVPLDATDRMLEALDRFCPQELARVGHPFAHRQGVVGMAFTAALFPATATATSARLLLSVDELWEVLGLKGAHADFLDVRLDLRDDGRLDIQYQIVEAKNRGGAVQPVAIKGQLGNTERALIRGHLDDLGESGFASDRCAAIVLTVLEAALRRVLGTQETLSRSERESLLQEVRHRVATKRFRWQPFPWSSGFRLGTAVSLGDSGSSTIEQFDADHAWQLVRVDAHEALAALADPDSDLGRLIFDPFDATDLGAAIPPAVGTAPPASPPPTTPAPATSPVPLPPAASPELKPDRDPGGQSRPGAVHSVFEGFIGNAKAVQLLSRQLRYAEHEKEDWIQSIGLYGAKSTGKTELARRVARALDVPVRELSRSTLSSAEDLAGTLRDLGGLARATGTRTSVPPMLVFIDEVHLLPGAVRESLLTAMEPSHPSLPSRHGDLDPSHVTFVVATTNKGKLDDAFRSRLLEVDLVEYDEDEMVQILEVHVAGDDLPSATRQLSRDALRHVARSSQLVPRRALELLRELGKAIALGDVTTQPAVVDGYLRGQLGVDEHGLLPKQREMLRALFPGRQRGLDSLAQELGVHRDTVETDIEPYLVRNGWIRRTAHGRELTDSGRSLAAGL